MTVKELIETLSQSESVDEEVVVHILDGPDAAAHKRIVSVGWKMDDNKHVFLNVRQ